MPESTYKIIELVGSSPTSWEEAVKIAVAKAAERMVTTEMSREEFSASFCELCKSLQRKQKSL